MSSENGVVNATSATFDNEVLKSDKLCIVDFWATWCGPCRMVAPILDELAGEYAAKAKVVKINVDEEPELAQQFKVVSIPAIFFIKNGEVVDKCVGARSKAALAEIIEANA